MRKDDVRTDCHRLLPTTSPHLPHTAPYTPHTHHIHTAPMHTPCAHTHPSRAHAPTPSGSTAGSCLSGWAGRGGGLLAPASCLQCKQQPLLPADGLLHLAYELPGLKMQILADSLAGPGLLQSQHRA